MFSSHYIYYVLIDTKIFFVVVVIIDQTVHNGTGTSSVGFKDGIEDGPLLTLGLVGSLLKLGIADVDGASLIDGVLVGIPVTEGTIDTDGTKLRDGWLDTDGDNVDGASESGVGTKLGNVEGAPVILLQKLPSPR
mmetsp:Transcript_34735/g.39575  ORF Transcript_34735/g.39575 Transcript_34735/m.39575 type:complete len:135 (-) Transcript_34735:480-884(-)